MRFEFRTAGVPPDLEALVESRSRFAFREVRYPPFVEDTASWIPPERPEDVVAMFGGALPPGVSLFEQYVDVADEVSTVWYWPLETSPAVVLDFRNAFVGTDEWGGLQLSCEVTAETGARLETVTARNLDRRLALTAASWTGVEVVLVPHVGGVFGDFFVLPAPFTEDEALRLSIAMRTGGLPAHVTIVDE